MIIEALLVEKTQEALNHLYGVSFPRETLQIQKTRKEFEGDLTLVVFPFLKVSKKNPVQTATELGNYLKDQLAEVSDFNVVKGFLNLVIADAYWLDFFEKKSPDTQYGIQVPDADAPAVMVEYSSPNTNKPLHLGHIRNNLLGYSVAEILKASGKRVYKVQIINDRGIHICKSMLAWQKFGEGETPESSGMKGDKLVGKYYVIFDKEYNKEADQHLETWEKGDLNLLSDEEKQRYEKLTAAIAAPDADEKSQKAAKGELKELARSKTRIIQEAKEMLRKWEAGDAEVMKLWETMNSWVYEGFNSTYKKLGVDFDKNYYESETYLLGKSIVQEGLDKKVFYKKADGSVWCNLSDEGLDEKLLLRSDGTAVYMTQDIGTAIQRFKDFDINSMTYTVGNEQDYHFKVLFLILKKLGYEWADHLHHLSYGMVDLPFGKMKSREGTVVDADDLIFEMKNTARDISRELGKLEGYDEEQKETLYQIIGLGALKYFMLKVDPQKRMLFNPAESIDFHGHTGPFIQYTYARIRSLLQKAKAGMKMNPAALSLQSSEKNLIKTLYEYPEIIQEAAAAYSPALIANYTYELVKNYNAFYQQVPIFGADDENLTAFRLQLSKWVARVIASSMKLLGIEMPERM